ncbi:hypothetical protein [Krasilnikovia sp. M28-CT-15]|uniref:hypothetical protein n=1 Tax=Krasilnikovia sp. M28-CT-15 TaxID=3373540 RepID=UPI003875B53B
MWSIDSSVVEAVRARDERYIRTVEVPQEDPYLDIDLIGDLTLTHGGDTDSLVKETLERFRRLREPLVPRNRKSDILINCGGLVVDPPERKADLWAPLFGAITADADQFLSVPGSVDVQGHFDGHYPYYESLFPSFILNTAEEPRLEPVAVISRVRLIQEGKTASADAYVAVIGFDSNDAYYHDRSMGDHGQVAVAQLDRARDLVRALAEGVASSAPLYVIAVTHHSLLPIEDHLVEGVSDRSPRNFHQGSLNAFGLLHHCTGSRISLIINTHMRAREVHSLMTIPVEPGRTVSEISIVACPSFEPVAERLTSGLAHLRINIWRGEAEIGYAYNDPDATGEPRQTQVIRSLASASRVSAAEQRLHTKIKKLIADERERADNPAHLQTEIDRFERYCDQVWELDGYAPLTFADGTIPRMRVGRFVRYNLLLLLRKQGNGSEYEMLMSHHTPLGPPRLADWNSILLPAFTSVRDLLEHLRDDVVRQVTDQAGDLDKARDAKRLEEAVERILDEDNDPERPIWDDTLREVSTMRRLKISPTTGQVTEYEYHLLTILPLVEASEPEGAVNDDAARIRSWLNALPAIRPDLQLSSLPSCAPIEAIEQGGAGLRWEPSVELEDTYDQDVRCTFKIPPGAIWWPIAASDESTGPWTRSPAITARNADVMRWVDSVLNAKRLADGSYPAELVLEGANASEHRELIVEETHSFADTCAALINVTYDLRSDLFGQSVYAGKEIRRVVLVRGPHGSRRRDAILVLNADDRRELGVLRPVQRYVRSPGIDRAEEIYQRLTRAEYDPWGYVRARKGPATNLVSITPPIIEQVAWEDCESDDGREFLLCDGNHRVVNSVWNHRRELAAVAVIGEPNQPYYAHPFGTYEWQCTSDTQVTQSVDNRFKYNARAVTDDDLQALSPQAREKLRNLGGSLLYRRYFRDLTSGFGDVGGQGGDYL